MSTETPSLAMATEPEDRTERREYRWAFEEVLDPETKYFRTSSFDELRNDLDIVAVPDDADSPAALLDALGQDAVAWWAEETERFRVVRDQAVDDADRTVFVNRTALNCAPFALTAGAWLQWTFSPVNVDTELGMRLLSLYSIDVGIGRVEASRGHAYLGLLRTLQLSERAIPTARLAMDRQISDQVFRLPAMIGSMGRYPDAFFPELIGADLCLRSVGVLPPVAALQSMISGDVDWDALDLSSARRSSDKTALEVARSLVDLHLSENPDDLNRVAAGFKWMLTGLRDWSSDVRADVAIALDPAHEMVELLRYKSREGAVYHQRYNLEGKPLNEWFALADAGDYDSLLKALAKSRLIRPGDPDRSPMLRSLVSERGPMFRIFTPDDLSVIRRWILSLTPEVVSSDSVPTGSGQPRARSASSRSSTRAAAADQELLIAGDREPANIREAFHLLTKRSDTPALRRWAFDYVQQWLARSAYEVPDAIHLPPKEWDPEALHMWIHDTHELQAEQFDATGEYLVPPRDELIDLIVQGGLRALIDGAWLQGFTDYEHASSDVGHLLYQIYWDELGNGDLPINHPVLYRDLLEDMGVHLPHVKTKEFAEWKGFREFSFEVPVYWLTISRFPRTFLPETLGLNLAEELFGVGGSLRQTQLGLKRYGYNTLFYDIHNTIDNVASGHSAWAVDAITSYMSAIARTLGSGVQAETWERVRVGFRSATPPFYVNGFLSSPS